MRPRRLGLSSHVTAVRPALSGNVTPNETGVVPGFMETVAHTQTKDRP